MFGIFGWGFFPWQKSTWQTLLVAHQLTLTACSQCPHKTKVRARPHKMPRAPIDKLQSLALNFSKEIQIIPLKLGKALISDAS